MLFILLIILKQTGPTTACGDACTSSSCNCNSLGLRSVPQFLPATVTVLYTVGNAITTLSQSDFSRYSSLKVIHMSRNQISVINSRAFYNLASLTLMALSYNQITSLRSDMFVGLDDLQTLYLDNNNIRSIEAGTFSTSPQLRYLRLHLNNISTIAAGAFENLLQLRRITLTHNRIKTFPSDLLSNLNISGLLYLGLGYNQMETLPLVVYDILVSVSPVYLNNNSWECDCKMLPFKQRMTGFYTFEHTIICAGPAQLQGSLLYDVSPQDLICEEKTTTETFSTPSTSSPVPHSTQHFHSPSATTTTPSTTHFQPGATEDTFSTSGSFSLSAFLSGFPGGIVGSLLILTIFLVVWCIKRRGKSSSTSAPMSDPSVVYSNIDEATASVSINVNSAAAAATAPIKGRDRTGHVASDSRAAEST
ncbi:SLIT and NTRK-like protein 5 [Branchiostoma lanceolatum]|uniref:SLIT and NTRK-like protein 5 n=1 Tax=Branchiostoma lanceolatum TaxID=7740 RepID=UPI0034544352